MAFSLRLDIDGTLPDTLDGIVEAMNAAAAEWQIPAFRPDQ